MKGRTGESVSDWVGKRIISALNADTQVKRLHAPLCLMEPACVRGAGVWTCPQTAGVKEAS